MDMTDQTFIKTSEENAKTDLAEVCAEIRAGKRSMTAVQRKTVEPQGGLNNADRPDGVVHLPAGRFRWLWTNVRSKSTPGKEKWETWIENRTI